MSDLGLPFIVYLVVLSIVAGVVINYLRKGKNPVRTVGDVLGVAAAKGQLLFPDSNKARQRMLMALLHDRMSLLTQQFDELPSLVQELGESDVLEKWIKDYRQRMRELEQQISRLSQGYADVREDVNSLRVAHRMVADQVSHDSKRMDALTERYRDRSEILDKKPQW